MAYVGNPIDTQNTFQSLVGKRFNGDGSTTDFTLDVAPGSTLDIEVFVGNVRQDPNSAYTVSGTTLSFTGAPPSGTNNIYVVHQAKSVGTITPGANSVGVTELNLSDGSSGQFIKTDGSGTLSFASVASLAGIDDQSSSNDDQLTITDTAVVINEDSDDVDFRVESNGNANMLFVSGGNDVVGIGAEGDLGNALHVKSGDSGASVASEADELVVEASGDSGISILSGTGNTGGINFGDSGDNDIGRLVYDQSGNSMRFIINANERMRIISTGNLCYGKSSDSFGTAGHIFYDETGSEGGTQFTSQTGIVPLSLNRLGDDGTLLGLFQASSSEGSISVSGSTVSYNTFCGTHWSRLADNSKPTILRGTVMESIGTMMNWYQAVADVAESTDEDGNVTPAHQVKESISLPNGKSVGDAVTFTSQGKEYTGKYVKEDNEQLPMCKISNTEESKGVYGVFMAWDDADNGLDSDVNDMYVASLGAFVVRIHKDETVAIGDYLQSKGDGTAKKQADDILRASTIAKVTSTEKTITHSDGSYCVPCTLHCG